MKVLIVHPSFYMYGGAELVIVRLVQYLQKQGVECTVLTSEMNYAVKRDLDCEIIIPEESLTSDAMLGLSKYLKEHYREYDVLNFHNHPSETLLYPYKHNSVWMHNEPPMPLMLGQRPNKTYLDIVRTIDIVVVSDVKNRTRFTRIYGKHDTRINHYGVDYEFFSGGKREDSEELRILQVGTIHYFKNQIASVGVLYHLLRRDIPCRLTIVGYKTYPYTNILQKYIHDLSLEKYVTILPWKDRTYLRKLYYSSDVLLHPIWFQGGWLSPFEALSTELLPVVSHDAPCSHLMKKHNIGVVTYRYVDVIEDYYNNPDNYDDAIRRGKEFTRSYMTWDRYCSNMLKYYMEVSE